MKKLLVSLLLLLGGGARGFSALNDPERDPDE
jgi:hypothetical protein